ncbi:MAG: prepilin peptidase [Candidatus Micrarchaeia archaeon]
MLALGIIIALIFLLAGSYYDIFRKRVVPDWLSYSFLAVALVYALLTGELNLTKAGGTAAILLIGYLIYRMGYVGGADVLFLASLMLLLPLYAGAVPSMVLLLLASTVLMAVYLEARFFMGGWKLQPRTEDIATAAIWIIGYAAVAYMLVGMGFQAFAVAALLIGLVSAVFALIKRDLNRSMVTWVAPKEIIEEDILAVEEMDRRIVEKLGLERLLTRKHIERIRKAGLKKVPVYGGLPPYIPFMLVGVLAVALLSLKP